MKRLSSLIVILLIALTILSANGNKESKDTSNTLRVAMECGYAPYNWTQTTDANGAVRISGSKDYAYGYDVMMAKYIAQELGKDLEIVKLDWDCSSCSIWYC